MRSKEHKVYRFAQTNLQLFNQMYDGGYDETQIAAVKKSYELAIVLFTGRFRGSGKTFIAHLVGTASILATLRAAPSMIAAGLLHAAYDSGDFGDGGQDITPAKQEYVRAAVGAEVEDYVARYTALKWNADVARRTFDKLDSLSRPEKDVVLIRLANELEDYLDLGVLFCGVGKRTQAGNLDSSGQVMGDIARRLGFPELAEAMKTELERTAVAKEQRRFEATGSRDFSFLAPPLSYKRLMDVLAKRLNQTPNRS
jgi:(p)ppGpp synthase/HD superfamily hydrolase